MSMILNGMALNLIHMITSMQKSNTSLHISRMFTTGIRIHDIQLNMLPVSTELIIANDS
jgi:hypothetical protein